MSDEVWIIILSLSIVLTASFLFFMLWVTSRMSSKEKILSPYSGFPMRRAQDLSYEYKARVEHFLESFHEFDNQPFSFHHALFCRETGRIFPNCRGWFGWKNVEWDFLKKRFPGNYVSWGSLSSDHQREIRESHASLSGFQTERSSHQIAPRSIEPEYAFLKPGPLYVDIQSKILLGWKEVPGTDLEVLVVQKPLRTHSKSL